MANSIAGLSIVISGNANPFARETARAEGMAARFTARVNKLGGGLGVGAAAGIGGGVAAGMTVATSAAGLATAGIGGLIGVAADAGTSALKLAASAEQAALSFGVMYGSLAKGQAIFKEIKALGAATPFQSKDLVETARGLAGMGVKADQLIPVLSRLGDVAQGDAEKLNRLGDAFGKTFSGNRFQADELNRFLEMGADASAFERAFGGSMGELRAAMEKGAVSARVMTDALNLMTNAGGRFFQ